MCNIEKGINSPKLCASQNQLCSLEYSSKTMRKAMSWNEIKLYNRIITEEPEALYSPEYFGGLITVQYLCFHWYHSIIWGFNLFSLRAGERCQKEKCHSDKKCPLSFPRSSLPITCLSVYLGLFIYLIEKQKVRGRANFCNFDNFSLTFAEIPFSEQKS